MSALNVIAIALYCIIFLAFFMNIVQVFKESKELKAQGKTPLVGKNITTVFIASLAEVLTVVVIILIVEPFFNDVALQVALLFSGIYLLKDVAAYLAAWGTWSVFVNIDKRKLKKQLEKEQEEALQ